MESNIDVIKVLIIQMKTPLGRNEVIISAKIGCNLIFCENFCQKINNFLKLNIFKFFHIISH
jgi:hypothetical protein